MSDDDGSAFEEDAMGDGGDGGGNDEGTNGWDDGTGNGTVWSLMVIVRGDVFSSREPES